MAGTEMSTTLNSTRFGVVEIDPQAVIEFPDGLIGLGGTRYVLLTVAPDTPFAWLHSLDDGALALPVTNPYRFFPGFRLALADEDAELLEVDASTRVDVYVTVRASPNLEEVVANQRAPIVVHAGRGAQVINQAPGMVLRAPLFPPESVLALRASAA